jgi:5-methylcytosine-specific restriction endonuclease McrA
MDSLFKIPRKNEPGEAIPQETKLALWERCRGRCEYCGKRAVDAHHIKYRSHGGNNLLKNLIALCRRCHENIDILKKISKNPDRYVNRYPW